MAGTWNEKDLSPEETPTEKLFEQIEALVVNAEKYGLSNSGKAKLKDLASQLLTRGESLGNLELRVKAVLNES